MLNQLPANTPQLDVLITLIHIKQQDQGSECTDPFRSVPARALATLIAVRGLAMG